MPMPTDLYVGYRRCFGDPIGLPDMLEFPTADTVGVPPGWTPVETWTTEDREEYKVQSQGQVVEDIELIGLPMLIQAEDVVIRRCRIVHSSFYVSTGPIHGGTKPSVRLEQCTVDNDPVGTDVGLGFAMGDGDFEAVRCAFVNINEGVRSGNGFQTVKLRDCFINLVVAEDQDLELYHGDGFQATNDTGGGPVEIKNTVIFTPQAATSVLLLSSPHTSGVTIDGLLCSGAGFPIRLDLTPCNVSGLYVVDESWYYDAVSIADWDYILSWEAYTCTVDAGGQPVIVAPIPRGDA